MDFFMNDGRGIDEPIREITKKYEILKKEVATLRAENARLKSEHYKDDELQRLQEKLEELREELSMGFPISRSEYDKIKGWTTKNNKNISSYRFDLIPGIGYDAYVIAVDGTEFCFYQE